LRLILGMETRLDISISSTLPFVFICWTIQAVTVARLFTVHSKHRTHSLARLTPCVATWRPPPTIARDGLPSEYCSLLVEEKLYDTSAEFNRACVWWKRSASVRDGYGAKKHYIGLTWTSTKIVTAWRLANTDVSKAPRYMTSFIAVDSDEVFGAVTYWNLKFWRHWNWDNRLVKSPVWLRVDTNLKMGAIYLGETLIPYSDTVL
jgi:hypothetical protein